MILKILIEFFNGIVNFLMVNMLFVRFDILIIKVFVYFLGKDLLFGIYGFL